MGHLSISEQQMLITIACKAADAARVITLSYFRQPDLQAQNKSTSAFDPVTIADRQAEAAIRAVLKVERPEDAILGEEMVDSSGVSGLTWVLDPIDGTRSYVSGIPTWGTLISVRDADGPLMGLIDQPYICERFIGGFGLAELRRGKKNYPLNVNPSAKLNDATILSTFPEIGSLVEYEAFTNLRKKTRLTRYGMDCYGYALLALGTVDLVVEAGLKPYDIQAPIAVIQAAGGVITDWHGEPAHEGGRVVAAASPELHQAALAVLRIAPPNI